MGRFERLLGLDAEAIDEIVDAVEGGGTGGGGTRGLRDVLDGSLLRPKHNTESILQEVCKKKNLNVRLHRAIQQWGKVKLKHATALTKLL